MPVELHEYVERLLTCHEKVTCEHWKTKKGKCFSLYKYYFVVFNLCGDKFWCGFITMNGDISVISGWIIFVVARYITFMSNVLMAEKSNYYAIQEQNKNQRKDIWIWRKTEFLLDIDTERNNT